MYDRGYERLSDRAASNNFKHDQGTSVMEEVIEGDPGSDLKSRCNFEQNVI